MRKSLICVFCLIAVTLYGQTAIAPSAGDGTIGNPYQISTIENLFWITENSSRWSLHYSQTANIDASETSSWFPDGSGGYYGWLPIGDFSGTYNGNEYSIYGIYINRTGEDYLGLFARTNGAAISNLGLMNVVIHGRHYTGGLVGYCNNNSTITNCFSIGEVTGSWHVGGLVADNHSSHINNCYTKGSVAGSPMIGGLAGSSQYSSTITNSYSTCSVSGGLYEIGGLVGGMFYSASVTNCYSTGTVTGPDFYLGGLIGRNYTSPAASNSFWDVQTSRMSISAGGTGKTTAEMKTQTTFTDAGWDFTSLWQMTTSENDEYPFLGWQDFLPQAYAPSKGDGTAGNPYQIANLGNLYWIAVDNSRWNKHYIQTADIDASVTSTWTGGGWIPIGNAATKFTGSYKGEGHLIDGLYINREGVDHQGLFGYTNGAVISELGVINVNIIAYRRTGALVGSFEANSLMNKCYSTGFVSGGHIIGLLVGLSTYSSITNCYSRGSVNGSSVIGGLLGYNYTGSTVSNSYSTANVVGAYGNNGGLIGVEWNASTTNSFWDTETSGQLTSGGGIGKTTAEMKTSSTFLDAGWNPQIWKKEDGINDGYIYLVWQNPDGSSLFQAPKLSLPVNNSTGISISPTLAWQAVSGADHYRLEINTQPDFTGTIIFDEDTLSDTSHTITGLLNNSTYYWRVQGLNNFGFSSDTSSTFSFTTKLLDAILSSPSNNSIGVGLSPTLNWLSVSGADKYKLEVNTQPDFTGTIIFNADTLTDTTQTINGLLNNSNYYWRVTALNDSGFASDISSTFLFTTKLSTAILSSPSNNSIGISLSPTLSWVSVSGADNYKLEVNTQPDFAGTIIFNADTLTDTAQTINELLNNSNYYWRITGLNNAGNTSDTSHTFSFTTLRTAVVEAIFTITDGAGGTTILTAGLDSSATDGLDSSYGEAELTPVPPAGIFDARFNFPDSIISSLKDIRQGTFREGFNRIHELQYQVGAGSSIIINYNFGTNTPDKVRARLQDIITGALIDTTISDTGSYTVTDPSVYSKLILTMIYDTPLPVELTSFSASSSNKDVKLQWSTATETNNRGFSIERKSKNINSWNTVAFVNGRGTTTELTNYSYTDKNVPAGIYNYRLKQVDFDGGFEYSKSVEFEVNAPKKLALEQNYPNPFNPATIINYQIPQDGIVTLIIYDVLGGEVRTLINEFKGAGRYEVKFDASDLSSGFYIYRLKANDFILSKKMLLVK